MRHFIDTNVFLYATGADHVYRHPCQQILQAVAAGELYAVTSAEVLQEVLNIFWRRQRYGAAREMVANIITLLSPDDVLPVTAEDVHRAAILLETFAGAGLSPRDCLHVAVMERTGIERIISTDGDFDQIPHITRIDPASFG